MLNKKYKPSKSQSGFTLIEMMVAIVVLGIVTIVIASVFSSIVSLASSDALIGDTRDDITVIENVIRSVLEEYDTPEYVFNVNPDARTDSDAFAFIARPSDTASSLNSYYFRLSFIPDDPDTAVLCGYNGSADPHFTYRCAGNVTSISFSSPKNVNVNTSLVECTIEYLNGTSVNSYSFLYARRTQSVP